VTTAHNQAALDAALMLARNRFLCFRCSNATAMAVIVLGAVRAGLSQREAERTARSGAHTGAGVASV
jgi:hypothetical protein